jgi:arylsulfatase A-like enzyme
MLGKWHCCPEDETNMASSKRNWPTGRGFERFYGYLGGETNQWYPDLVQDQQFVDQPYGPDEGYHLSKDLTDRAIAMIADAKQVAPDRPFFMYFCPGANHAPHHAPKEWSDKYKGKFDMGYEKIRKTILERQKKLGIVPENTELTPINPYADQTGVDGTAWPESDTQLPWDSLSDDEKKPFERMAEVYAGFSSYTDHEIARLIEYLEQTGELDNTIVVSSPTTAPRARAARPARSTRTSSSTASRMTSRRTSRGSTSSAPRRPTTTTRSDGRRRSTRRSSSGSATPTTAACVTR